MTKIISISVSDADESLLAALDALGGSRSKHVVEAIREYVGSHGSDHERPFWYVEGKDYSHLPLETRQQLMKFGYTDSELVEKDAPPG
jgi:hypothetical protein